MASWPVYQVGIGGIVTRASAPCTVRAAISQPVTATSTTA